MKQTLRIAITFTSLTFVALTACTLPAGAAPVYQGVRLHTGLRNGTSTNWAGYAVETNLTTPQSGSVSNVSGTWKVPAMTCTGRTTSYSSSWIGIDGYSDNTVEQTGTEQDCVRGQAQYYAWYEFYPQSSIRVSLPVQPGNTITANVKYASSNTFTLTLTDQTTNRTFNLSYRTFGNVGRQSAEWIAEAPSSRTGVLPLANFGTMNFTQALATLNGHTGTISDPAWQHDAVSMLLSVNGPAKALPSTLTPDGSGFGVTWQHS